MYVACSTRCFGPLPLPDALRKIREMGFQKAELTVGGGQLSLDQVLEDPGRVAQILRVAALGYSAFSLDFPDESDAEENLAAVRAVGRLARATAAPVISVQAAPAGCDFDDEVERLETFERAARAEGVIFAVETQAGTLTGDPATAADLCRRVPGLGLTLDPSHFLGGPNKPDSVDPLFGWVRHVRMRDSGREPGQFQVRVGKGQVEFGRVITKLQRCGYSRALTIDIRDCGSCAFPVPPEVRKLKYLLESMV